MSSSEKFDVIFCRNVLSYFSAEDQIKAADNLLSYLRLDGVLVTGVSESLSYLLFSLKSLAPSIYGTPRRDAVGAVTVAQTVVPIGIPKPLRVLCIDDSPAMIKIFKKLLATPEFEVVGTAANGIEAQALLETCRPDVVTLDLHMPIMDGFALVRESDIALRMPVLVVSSVDRANASLVEPLFERGVCDFLEKPSFENFNEIGDELRQKLKMAWLAKP